jgi:hypothetical protein
MTRSPRYGQLIPFFFELHDGWCIVIAKERLVGLADDALDEDRSYDFCWSAQQMELSCRGRDHCALGCGLVQAPTSRLTRDSMF